MTLIQRSGKQMKNNNVVLFVLFFHRISTLTNSNDSSVTISSHSNETEPYCSFFSNRAPSPQPALTNCTWYKEKSCCRDNEVRLIFSQVRPLIGSSDKCTKFLNILMCYVCSPLQYGFYRRERLHVCLTYCNRMYQACATALMKGTPVGELYANGREFCLSRRFEISDFYNSSSCFSDDDLIIEDVSSNGQIQRLAISLSFLVLFRLKILYK